MIMSYAWLKLHQHRILIKGYKKQYNNTIMTLNIGNEQLGKDKLHANGILKKKTIIILANHFTNNEYFNYNYAHFVNLPK